MLIPGQTIAYTELPSARFLEKQVQVTVARLDLIHPVVSGNKLFKLHYFLKECGFSQHKQLLTFGGAYSNHLVATAFAGQQSGFRTIGIVRGLRPPLLSHSLENCLKFGMHLEFVDRDKYKNLQEPSQYSNLSVRFGESIIIPEGGFAPMGADGAALIMNYDQISKATHICTAVGTATTLAGLLKGSVNDQEMIAVPVLKGMHDIPSRLDYLLGKDRTTRISIFDEYHFGGYAKRTPQLVDFMNELYMESAVPTDFVYTAKMMYAVFDKIRQGYFPPGSRIICLHTGGLQGNASLPPGTIIF